MSKKNVLLSVLVILALVLSVVGVKYASVSPSDHVSKVQFLAFFGNTPAQRQLAQRYERGVDVPADSALAAKWFGSAAEGGDPVSQNQMAALLEEGMAVEKDPEKALSLYRLAAEQGNYVAMANLGRLYENGIAVAQNLEEAAKWYGKAAASGHAGAQHNLGMMYLEGRGVQKNEALAAEFFQQAATQGFGPSQANLARMFVDGAGLGGDLVKAGYWYSQAAQSGLEEAKEFVQDASTNCISAPKNTPGREADCFIAAGAGLPNAQFYVGTYYDAGHIVSQNKEEAVRWFQRSAEQGHILAQAMLGKAFAEGAGIARDPVQAYAWLSLAAQSTPENSIESAAIESIEELRGALLQRMNASEQQQAQLAANELLLRFR